MKKQTFHEALKRGCARLQWLFLLWAVMVVLRLLLRWIAGSAAYTVLSLVQLGAGIGFLCLYFTDWRCADCGTRLPLRWLIPSYGRNKSAPSVHCPGCGRSIDLDWVKQSDRDVPPPEERS